MTNSRHTIFAILLVLALLAAAPAPARVASPARNRAPQASDPIVTYTMTVTLDKATYRLTGREEIVYRNASNRPITELAWHLYLNAFRSADTLFMRESGGQMRGFAFDPAGAGWTEVDSLTLADGTDLWPATRVDETVMTTTLPAALPPGGTLSLALDFHAQLPRAFARTGYAGDFVLAGQWFPKLAVHDDAGWHNFPFHATTEFFSDFGDYDVTITVPAGEVTGATGVPDGPVIANPDGTQTVRYRATNVIDFVWTTSPHYLTTGRDVDGIEVVLLYQPEHTGYVTRYLDITAASLRAFGRKYGPYPYPRLTIVDPPDDAGGAGGMEYPMFVTGGTLGAGPLAESPNLRILELVTSHEVGHEWFGMTAASNEADEPWLDEGFTDFISTELMRDLYGERTSVIDLGLFQLGARDMRRIEYLATPDTPTYGKAWELPNYGVAAYSKPVMALTTLKGQLGEAVFDRVMQTYYTRYQFRHPTTADFQAVAEEVSGRDLDAFFTQVVYGDQTLDYAVTAVEEHAVVTARLAPVILPVTLAVTFADGQTQTETWDGVEAERRWEYPDRVVTAARLDPDGLMALDVNRTNNSLARDVVPSAWKALARWLFWMEHLMLILGGQG